MKNLLLSLCMLAFVAISSSAFAQTDTGTTPLVGSVHTYSVTGGGGTFAWSITTDEAGATPVATSVAEITSGSGTNSIEITWHNPSPGTGYFVHVVETLSGCTNHKSLSVKPVNGFELDIVNVDDADAVLAANAAQCAPDVAVTSYDGSNDGTLADAQDFTYAYGTVDMYYRIQASGINTTTTGWSPQFTIATTNTTGATVSATWGTTASATGGTGVLSVDGTTNDIDVAAGNEFIWIKVTIANGSALEGLTAQDITVSLIGTAGTSQDENGNDVTSINSGSQNQVVSARPNTGEITTTGL